MQISNVTGVVLLDYARNFKYQLQFWPQTYLAPLIDTTLEAVDVSLIYYSFFTIINIVHDCSWCCSSRWYHIILLYCLCYSVLNCPHGDSLFIEKEKVSVIWNFTCLHQPLKMVANSDSTWETEPIEHWNNLKHLHRGGSTDFHIYVHYEMLQVVSFPSI